MDLKNCVDCSKEFRARKSVKFCSRDCYWKSLIGKEGYRKGQEVSAGTRSKMSAARIGKASWNKGKKMSAEYRQNVSERQKGKRLGRDNNFYGKKHTPEALEKMGAANKSGPESRRWKGGITPLHNAIRGSKKNREWVVSCLQRDGFTCQSCHAKRPLVVHHIREFSKILHDNKIKSFEEAMLCRDFWDTENGVTLCYDCHSLIHGRKIHHSQRKRTSGERE